MVDKFKKKNKNINIKQMKNNHKYTILNKNM